MMFGVCRTIKPSGPLDGFLCGRFLTVFFACFSLIATRGAMIAFIVNYPRWMGMANIDITGLVAASMVLLLFVPQLLIAIFSAAGFTNKSFIICPETVLLPTGIPHYLSSILYNEIIISMIVDAVSFFTFTTRNTSKKVLDIRIGFSKTWSLINFLVSTAGFSGVSIWLSSFLPFPYIPDIVLQVELSYSRRHFSVIKL